MVTKRLILLCLIAGLLAAGTTLAQEETIRDPAALAEQLLGHDGRFVMPAPVPQYQLGDIAEFWVTKRGQDAPTRVAAELIDGTGRLYIWAEDGVAYNPNRFRQVTVELDAILAILQLQANVGGIRNLPQSAEQLEMASIQRLPDVDNDPHVNILFAQDVATTRAALFNPNDSLPAEFVPGGYSNERELVIVNTSALPGVALDDPTYRNLLATQFYDILNFYNNPGQAPWLRSALNQFTLLQLQDRALEAADLATFFSTPNTSLVSGEFGVGQLFLRYVIQRFGLSVFNALVAGNGSGLAALDRALRANGVTDLATGDPVTGADVFADFVMTNLLNSPMGDGRFVYTQVTAAQGLNAPAAVLQDQFNVSLNDQAVSQLGAAYLGLTTTEPTSFTLFFNGASSVSRLPMPGDSGNRFYWSGTGVNQSRNMTRAFDLTGTRTATLTFDVWYLMIDGWNYGYIEVSDDGGQTWDVLPAATTATRNPFGTAYGPGFTGSSNPEAPRPFAYMGVTLDSDGVSLLDVPADGPAARAGLRAGDVIAGYDGRPWPEGEASVVNYLAQFRPGDTINLYVQRGGNFLDVTIELGAHPTRVFTPAPLWLEQTVNLNAYAGKPILVRFDYASLTSDDNGLAIDNIAIPEIDFYDDAESAVPGWTLNGWQQTTNEVPQRFLVQYALVTNSVSDSRVERLIGPGDSATEGAWTFNLAPGQIFALAIAGLNEDTLQPARFSLAVRPASG